MKNLNTEYKKAFIGEDMPDLWSRIESSLPEKKMRRFPVARYMSLAAAALFLALIIPGSLRLMQDGKRQSDSLEKTDFMYAAQEAAEDFTYSPEMDSAYSHENAKADAAAETIAAPSMDCEEAGNSYAAEAVDKNSQTIQNSVSEKQDDMINDVGENAGASGKEKDDLAEKIKNTVELCHKLIRRALHIE